MVRFLHCGRRHFGLVAAILLAACQAGESSSRDSADAAGAGDARVGGQPDRLAIDQVRFGAVGDFGGRDDRAGTVLADLARRQLDGFFLLGDASYGEITPESAWCDWVHGYLGPDYPFEVLAGNHEEDSRTDGHITAFADCMPDRLSSDLGPGGYGVNFAADLGPVTVIAIAPDLIVQDMDYRYQPGSAERQWLSDSIGRAHADNDWVVVAMHKLCLSIGNKSCEIGAEFAQWLIDHDVDLVLQSHDHSYQRSHALVTVRPGQVGEVGDSGDDEHYVHGSGTVFAVVGNAGSYPTKCSHTDSEFGNFAAHWCREEANDTHGYLLVSADPSQLEGQYVTTVGTQLADRFSVE